MTAHTKFDNQPKSDAWGIKLQGKSYLYPFNLTTPRNCGNQLIPFDYCICQFNSETRTSEKQPLAVRLANHMVERMNHEFEVNNASHLCMPLTRDNSSDVEILEWEPESKTNVYHVTYRTQPGGGKFWAYVQVFNEDGKGGKETFKMISDKMPRLNSYGDQAFCTDDPKYYAYDNDDDHHDGETDDEAKHDCDGQCNRRLSGYINCECIYHHHYGNYKEVIKEEENRSACVTVLFVGMYSR
ncbi:Protein R03G8.1 [Aphelenchoides avenae]|nr:Protein R03G8.1 [Aphelenchus avenae]